MKKHFILSSLTVFLLCSTTVEADSGNVECHIDLNEGFGSNAECEIGFPLVSVNGCPKVTTPIQLSAVGRKYIPKVNHESPLVSLDRCRFNGNNLVCNCGSKHCNKNADIIWGLISTAKFELSDECDAKFKLGVFEIVSKWKNGTVVPLPKPELIQCVDSNTGVASYGHFCLAEVAVAPGTCLITGKPILLAGNITEEECSQTNKVKIICHTDNCNNDIESLQTQIEAGIVSGGAHNLECKKQLRLTIADAFKTEVQPKEPKCTRNPSGAQYDVAFVLDGSYHTMEKTQNQSLSAVVSFVKYASRLLKEDDRTYVRVYGGQLYNKTQGRRECYYRRPENHANRTVEEELFKLQTKMENSYAIKAKEGWGQYDHTVIWCGFIGPERPDVLSVPTFFKNETTTTRIIIHIGTGMSTGWWNNVQATTEINKLKSAYIQVISVSPKWGNTKQMKEWSTDPRIDYFEVDNLDSKSLSMDLAKKILHAECKERESPLLVKE